MHVMNNFMRYESIICGSFSRNETILKRLNYRIQVGADPINKHFGDDLEENMAKTYWLKFLLRCRTINLRNMHNQSIS